MAGIVRRSCPNCREFGGMERPAVNHLLHFIFTVLTGTLWGWGWLYRVLTRGPWRCQKCDSVAGLSTSDVLAAGAGFSALFVCLGAMVVTGAWVSFALIEDQLVQLAFGSGAANGDSIQIVSGDSQNRNGARMISVGGAPACEAPVCAPAYYPADAPVAYPAAAPVAAAPAEAPRAMSAVAPAMAAGYAQAPRLAPAAVAPAFLASAAPAARSLIPPEAPPVDAVTLAALKDRAAVRKATLTSSTLNPDRESEAGDKMVMAWLMVGKEREAGKKQLQEVIENYEGTAAAEMAAKLLTRLQ